MKRKVINIDPEKCTGCGECIPNCPEGAIQMIDGKAKLVSDLFCDGLGACIGRCPEGAITIEEREAPPYDEARVMANIVKQGDNVIEAHLAHLREHGETGYLAEAVRFLEERGMKVSLAGNGGAASGHPHPSGCPGARVMDFTDTGGTGLDRGGKGESQLRQWPVQLHLVPPTAPYFNGKDVVLAADCVAYALADFHRDHLKGKSLAIACPKLDSEQEIYSDKITTMIDGAGINTLTVITMEVPCCNGLLALAREAAKRAERKIPIKHVVVGIKGGILKEEWVTV